MSTKTNKAPNLNNLTSIFKLNINICSKLIEKHEILFYISFNNYEVEAVKLYTFYARPPKTPPI